MFPKHAPWATCEAVVSETAHLSGNPQKVMQLVRRGDRQIRFAAEPEATRLAELLGKYQDYGMDLADACLVRIMDQARMAFCSFREENRSEFPTTKYTNHTKWKQP